LAQSLQAAFEAARSAHSALDPPAGHLVSNELDHPRRIERPDGTAAAFPRHDLVAQGTSLRPARQVDQRSLWVVQCIRVGRHMSASYSKEVRNSVAIGKKPSFNRADDNPEAHVWRRIGQPPCGAWRRAFTIAIKIDEDDPWSVVRRGVVAANRPEQRRLSAPAVYVGKRQAGFVDDPMEHRLVEVAFHCAGHDRQGSIPEQGQLLRPWGAGLG
jgi:hypothetical protein